jgi:hypothetical protein
MPPSMDRARGAYIRQVLQQGVYHADPHRGNVLLSEDGRLALLDFGLLGRLDEHIATAESIPWAQAVRDDGTFRPREELAELYESKGVTPGKEVTAYCRIGERSAHTWFVLRELLGYEQVRNYDGAWTEWGNLVDVPIERGS